MEGPAFSQDIALTLAVTLAAIALLVWNRLRPEVVGLIVMVTLVLVGLLGVEESISGFANEATVTVTLMMGLSTGLLRTGAVDLLGQWIGRFAGDSEWRLTVTIVALVVPVSALINNTAAVAILLPMVMGLSRNADAAPSRLLMPLSFASQLGGTLTLIGTSTNLLVAGMVLDLGMERIGIFEITPVGAVLAAVGIAYLLTVGRRLVPHRESVGEMRSSRNLRQYLTELEVTPDSKVRGRPIDASGLDEELDLRVVGVWRDQREIKADADADLRLEAGDRVLVRGSVEAVAAAESRGGLARVARATEEPAAKHSPGSSELAELMISPRSRAIDLPLVELKRILPEGVEVLAMERHGAALERSIQESEVAAGDILLVRSPREQLESMHRTGNFALLGVVELPQKRTEKRSLASLLLAGVVGLAASGVTTILVAALLGLLAMVLTHCVTAEEVYEGIDWQVVVLLGAFLSLGTAMETTGTAAWLAAQGVGLTSGLGPHWTLGGFYLLTAVLTGFVSNNASAVVLTPVAVSTAQALGLSPLPFVVAVMLAASNSFITPIGYQTNTFIFGPGGYRFSDFFRVGGPLTLLLTLVSMWVIPWFMPF